MRHYNGRNVFNSHSWMVKSGGQWVVGYDVHSGFTHSASEADLDDARRMGKAFADGAIKKYEEYDETFRPKNK